MPGPAARCRPALLTALPALLLVVSLAVPAQAVEPPWEKDAAAGALACRTRDGAVQVRLKDSTVERLGQGGTVVARTPLPGAPLALAFTRGGDVVALDLRTLTRIRPDGAIAWTVVLQPPARPAVPPPPAGSPPAPAYCGYPHGLAVGPADQITVACGYSLLRFAGTGQFLWQKWPVGNHRISAPLTDEQGRIYVSGQGLLLALSDPGAELWRVDAASGFPHPRHLGRLAWDSQGNLLFRTTMAGLHSPTDHRGIRRYYIRKPPELLRVSRQGAVLARELLTGTLADAGRTWPAHLPPPPDCSGRMP